MKILTLGILLVMCTLVHAQENRTIPDTSHKNIIKLNLLALGLKNISVEYERAISKKTSVNLGFRFMPTGKLPFPSLFESVIDDELTRNQFKNLETGNVAFTTAIKWYVGKNGFPKGFYISPYTRVARYKASLPFTYEDGGTNKQIPLSGSVNTFTAGILFGSQWALTKNLTLDWWILGPGYGTSKGLIDGRKSLTFSEQNALRNELDDLEIPFTKLTYTVDANGATINFKGPWAGLRTGLCLGFSF